MKTFLLVVPMLLMAVGCGSSDPNLIPIRGTVSYQGKPLNDGFIRFVPSENSQAPVRVAPVVAGSYELAETRSLLPGTYQIQIEGFEGSDIPASDPSQPGESRRQILPPQYNAKTKIEPLTVNSGDAAQLKDFELN